MKLAESVVEIWRPVPGFERYQASSLGRIRNTQTDYILKPQPVTSRYSERKYWQVRLMWGSKKKREGVTMTVHRIVGMTFQDMIKGDPELGMNHLDGDKANNAVDNLERATGQENCQHAIETGLFRTKWTKHKPEIVQLRAQGYTIREIHEHFVNKFEHHIPASTISTILTREGKKNEAELQSNLVRRSFAVCSKWLQYKPEIVQLRNQGLMMKQIQEHFSAKHGLLITKSTISTILTREGVKKGHLTKWSDQDCALLLTIRNELRSINGIAPLREVREIFKAKTGRTIPRTTSEKFLRMADKSSDKSSCDKSSAPTSGANPPVRLG